MPITTDGTPVTVGSRNGFVGLFGKDESIPMFIAYRSVIHQEALYIEDVNFKHVMNVINRVIISIRSVTLKKISVSKISLEYVESENFHLIFHTEVRWLSTHKVLTRFLELAT
jgi:hypothetical protein